MIAALAHWFRGRRLACELERNRADLKRALHWHKNNGDAMEEMRALIAQLEQETALHRLNAGSGFRARRSKVVERWRLWGA